MFKRTKRAARHVSNAAKQKHESFVDKNGPRRIMKRAQSDAQDVMAKLDEDQHLADNASRQIKYQQVIVLKLFGIALLVLLILWVVSILVSI